VHSQPPSSAPAILATPPASDATTTSPSTSPVTWTRRRNSRQRSFHYASFESPDAPEAKIGEVILVKKHGIDLLHDPLFNKGSAFPLSERER
jgi:hypothetical protein